MTDKEPSRNAGQGFARPAPMAGQDPPYATLHRALMAGLPTHIGQRGDKGLYDGPRGRKFQLFPGSPLAKKPPPWVLAATLLVVEIAARDVSLALVAAPLAAVPTICANLVGLVPGVEPPGARGAWLVAHIALSFVGIAAFATAAAAGCMYLIERRELKSRRFGAIYRFFPPLATLDRVNHVAAIAGWLVLTLGVVLAITYALTYHELSAPKIVWAMGAWLAVSGIALGRSIGGWQARRAAIYSSVSFAAVVVLYVAVRMSESNGGGRFL